MRNIIKVRVVFVNNDMCSVTGSGWLSAVVQREIEIHREEDVVRSCA